MANGIRITENGKVNIQYIKYPTDRSCFFLMAILSILEASCLALGSLVFLLSFNKNNKTKWFDNLSAGIDTNIINANQNKAILFPFKNGRLHRRHHHLYNTRSKLFSENYFQLLKNNFLDRSLEVRCFSSK